MANNSYASHHIQSGLIGDADETARFNMAMDYILNHIEKPEPDMVRAAFANAPLEILEYFAQDKWFVIARKASDVPVYSHIAREILIERVVLGGTERK
jgi:hypothetical protein